MSPLLLRYVVPIDFFSSVSNFFYIISLIVICIVSPILGIISIPVIIFRATKKHKQSWFFVSFLTIFFTTVFFMSLSFFLRNYILGGLPIGSNLLKFNSIEWKAKSSGEDVNGISKREKMLKDIVVNILPGKSRDEMEKLLGPSLEATYFKDSGRDLIYFLGPERASLFNIDSEWLLIWFDENGKFEKYKIVND
ncbi:MAG: hypothetical protein V1833_01375 [Elusimicrobiota bacterium]